MQRAANAAQGRQPSSVIHRSPDIFAEVQRRAAQTSLSLSEESLEEYRRL